MGGSVDGWHRRAPAFIRGSLCLSSGKTILGKIIEGTQAGLGGPEAESFCPASLCLPACSRLGRIPRVWRAMGM
jgi:hypothetical protein